MEKKKDYNYYAAFTGMVKHADAAADMLIEVLESYRPENLRQMLSEMHTIEHSADLLKHDMMAHLATEFITPIEREDIISISQLCDTVVDDIEDVLINLYNYHVTSLRDGTVEFACAIKRCCEALLAAFEMFPQFKKKSDELHELIIRVNNFEEDADKLYTENMYQLYGGNVPAEKLLAWTEVYKSLENCCDACEDASEAMELVIMKNS